MSQPLMFWLVLSFLCFPYLVLSQDEEKPEMAAASVTGSILLDGHLAEADWEQAQLVDAFKTVVPDEGGTPSGRTTMRVLTHPRYLLIGVECFDEDPSGIVNFSKLRDSDLEDEDHIRIVIDPFLDGQSGIILAVNASGARYDALVSNRGESENEDWDAIWEAKAVITDSGWTVEIRIPVQSFSFNKGLRTWGFNLERRIQRYQETIRWANIRRDQWFIQTSRAGLLTNLPEFSYGVGLNIRPSLIGTIDQEVGEEDELIFDPSLTISQRLGANVTATITANTDFAETEVDTRQT
ncbi:MAG: carbohydrate binding family 9 domain-containing protein, partial [Bacteroidota bacterium]